MASRSLTTFAWRSIWCWSSSGPWRPTHSADGMKAVHLTTAADHPWIFHHSSYRVSRTSHMPSRPGSASASPLVSTSTAVCCASSTSNSSPARNGRGSFCAAFSSHGSSRRLAPAAGRARLTLPESANFCSCAGVHARLQELDPPRGGQTLRRVLLGSRVQLRTCQSGLQHRSAPPAAALVRAHSSTGRRQPATSNRWLALHRLEGGGAP